ncbi:MAG: hypothetical protein AABZ47_00500 [Planctomycetota bacterium]
MKLRSAIPVTVIGLALSYGCGNAPTTSAPGGTGTRETLPETIIDGGGVPNDGNFGSTGCNTTFYNGDFGFGFDLLPEATRIEADGYGLYFAFWNIPFGESPIGVATTVNYDTSSGGLAQFVADRNLLQEVTGASIIDSFPITLADGTPAFFTAWATLLLEGVESVTYSIDVHANGYAYWLSTKIVNDDVLDITDPIARNVLSSLCVEQ